MIEQFLWLVIFCLAGLGRERGSCIFLFLLLSCLPACASSGVDRVVLELFAAHRPFAEVRILPPFRVIEAGSDRPFFTPLVVYGGLGGPNIENGVAVRQIRLSGGRHLHLSPCGRQPIALLVPGLKPRRYRGDILITSVSKAELSIKNQVSRRTYINDVVASETLPGTPAEMLKAQAIMSQTLLARSNHLVVLNDSTETQSYLGAGSERPEVNAAVSAVFGKLLCHQGAAAQIYFHSTCGGGTSNAAQYFALRVGGIPYLQGVACKYCRQSPFWEAQRVQIPMSKFSQIFADGMPHILKRDLAGRALSVKLADGKILNGYCFWLKLGQNFGWDKAPGTRYSFAVGPRDSVIIESSGAGHGVGLCQWGGAALAGMGKNYKQILQYYFPGCEIL